MALTRIGNTGITTNGVHAVNITNDGVATAKIDDAAITAAKIAAGGITVNAISIASLASGNAVFTHVNNIFKKAQVGQVVTLGHIKAEGAVTSNTVTLNLANGNHFSWTTNAAITLANPTNANTGQTGSIVVTSNGNYTVSFAENWRFPSGTAPTLSTTAGQTDRIDYHVIAANAVQAVATTNYDDKA